jgi:hypothetical protein
MEDLIDDVHDAVRGFDICPRDTHAIDEDFAWSVPESVAMGGPQERPRNFPCVGMPKTIATSSDDDRSTEVRRC